MASCSGNGSRGHHKFTLNVWESYVSGGADNYSTVSWSLDLSAIVTGYNWNYSSTVPVSFKVTINGTDFTGNIMSYNSSTAVTVGNGSLNVPHNSDGSKSISFSFSVWDNISASYLPGSASGSGSMTLTKIGRYTSITSFSVSKRNETSVSVSYTTSDNIDWAWYSKDNGANWSNLPNSNIIDGLSPNTTYNFKIRVRRADSQLTTDSWTVAQTTYKAPSQSLRSKTETSITMNWSLDTTANHLWYSINNGSSWVEVGNVNATSGYYTITGLSPNTTYNIKTRLRRSSTNTTYDSSNSSQATYNYPYCTEAPNFTIGNNVTIKLYNPLNRTVEIQMWSYVKQGFVSDRISVSGTSYTGFSGVASRLYASIPNTNQSQYNIDVWYGNNKATKAGGYYKITGNEVPTFNNFTYRDSNSTVTTITGNNQVMVKGLSTPEITISSANKMVANNSASGKNYSITIGNLSDSVNYSDNDVVKQLGIINVTGTQRLSVTAFDSRGLNTVVNKNVTVYDYSKPVINASVTRLNNFENETTLRIEGTYNKLTIDDINKNSITSVEYRYKESGGDWGNWQTVTATVNDGSYTCSDILLNLDNTKSFDFEVRTIDSLQQVTTNSYILDVGKAAFFIKKDGGFQANGDSEINGDLTITENITFPNASETGGKYIKWQMGTNDYARIYSAANDRNAGYLEIATADDANEPIYIRQYTGQFTTLARTATLLDANGHTILPGNVNAKQKMYIESGAASTDVGYFAKRTDTNTEVWMGVGSGGTNHGVYSMKLNKWLLHGDATYTCVNGEDFKIDSSGNATLRGKLTTGNAICTAACTSRKTINYSTEWTLAKIPLDVIKNSKSSVFEISNGGVKVKRTMKALISARCSVFQSTLSGEFDLHIHKNNMSGDALADGHGNITSTATDSNQISPILVDLAANDVLYLTFASGATGTYKFLYEGISTNITIQEV